MILAITEISLPPLPALIGIIACAVVLIFIIIYRKPVKKFLGAWEEIYTLPLSWVLFFFSSYLFWLIDPTAAVFDIGALQLLIFATCGMLWANGITWIFIRRYYPTVYDYIQDVFDEAYNGKLTTWERVKFFLYYFAINFLGFILLVRVL